MGRVLLTATVIAVALTVGAAAKDDAAAQPPSKRERALALVKRGTARAMKQDWSGAETSHREAIAVDKMTPGAWYGLGHALAKQQRWSEATAALDEALLLKPDYPAALEALGRLHAQRGNLEKAEDMLDRLRELDDRRAATLRHVIREAKR